MDTEFDQIKQIFQNRVYSLAYYSLRVAEDAEDVTQETFLRLWQNLGDIKRAQLGAWLMRVTHNLVIDHVRKQKSRLPNSDEDTNLIDQQEKTLDQGMLKKIVEQSIAKLNDPYRTTIILREMQGMSYQEISDVLLTSENQVKTDLYRAKQKLRELVKQHPNYSHDLLHLEPES